MSGHVFMIPTTSSGIIGYQTLSCHTHDVIIFLSTLFFYVNHIIPNLLTSPLNIVKAGDMGDFLP